MLKLVQTNATGNQARIAALSHARLSNYRTFFSAATTAELLGLYQWNDDLSAVLFRTISLVEVVLRNRFHHAMSLRYGAAGGHGSKDWYQHVALDAHAKSKILGITHTKQGRQIVPRIPAPSPDDVVSGLTFGFWPHLLDLKKDLTSQIVDWGPILVDVLPGHRQQQPTHWAKQKHRDVFFARLDLCNELRNRIAHHEPIWKLGPLLNEGRARKGAPLTVHLMAPTTPAEAVLRLSLLYSRVIELLSWLAPDVASQHTTCELHLRCLSLLRLETVMAYQQGLPLVEIDLAQEGSLRTLRKSLRYAARHKQPVIVKDGHRLIGYLTSTPL
jgi:hypothetical protein